MILFPNCKINLGLRITGKRTDGYHNIETLFYPLPLKDAAEIIIPDPTGIKNGNNGFELILTGTAIPGNQSDNLCRKAWELIKKDFPDIPDVQMYLHKTIPIGAGLGGGSSNGAYTLLLLNHKLGLFLSDEQLKAYALKLGSDCPFFIVNKPCLATGRGEQLVEIELKPEEDYYFILVDPGIHVNTAWAFSQTEISETVHRSLSEIIKQPIDSWKDLLVNEFEIPLFIAHPQLATIKQNLYRAGAVYASMTGTGSCLYGIFKKEIPHQHMDLGDGQFKVHILNRNQ